MRIDWVSIRVLNFKERETMAKLIFEGLSLTQARVFASWYEGQGEQEAEVWFDNQGVETPITDCGRDGGYVEIDKKKEVVTVFLK